MRTCKVRAKAYGDSADAVQAVVDALLNIYQGYSSPIIKSEPSGFHAFLTLEVEAA
jgi:hypothetical protein